jgi:translation initiation factor 5
MPKLNVNRTFKNDPSYRYKMSEVDIKFEGGGNGKRTILMNIGTISTELSRNVDNIVSYLSTVLGCQSIVNKEGKYVLYGDFTKQKLQDLVFDYVDEMVICKKCKNPETYYILHGKNDVGMKCKACPEMSLLVPSKKVTKILKQIGAKLIEENKNKK